MKKFFAIILILVFLVPFGDAQVKRERKKKKPLTKRQKLYREKAVKRTFIDGYNKSTITFFDTKEGKLKTFYRKNLKIVYNGKKRKAKRVLCFSLAPHKTVWHVYKKGFHDKKVAGTDEDDDEFDLYRKCWSLRFPTQEAGNKPEKQGKKNQYRKNGKNNRRNSSLLSFSEKKAIFGAMWSSGGIVTFDEFTIDGEYLQQTNISISTKMTLLSSNRIKLLIEKSIFVYRFVKGGEGPAQFFLLECK